MRKEEGGDHACLGLAFPALPNFTLFFLVFADEEFGQ